MTKHLVAVGIALLLLAGCAPSSITEQGAASADQVIANAYGEQRSGVQVTGAGIVTRVLTDDSEGSRHQRFILTLGSGQTLLVTHNIDIAPRITSISIGDEVEFNGVYEWNDEGGVIHWTHHDPAGEHEAGWLRHNGLLYQ